MLTQLFTLLIAVIKSLTPTQLLSFRVKSSTFTVDKRKNPIVDETCSLNLRDIAGSVKSLAAFVTTNEESSFEISYPKADADTYAKKAQEICAFVASARASDGSLSAVPIKEYNGQGDKTFAGYKVAVTPIDADDVMKQLSSL